MLKPVNVQWNRKYIYHNSYQAKSEPISDLAFMMKYKPSSVNSHSPNTAQLWTHDIYITNIWSCFCFRYVRWTGGGGGVPQATSLSIATPAHIKHLYNICTMVDQSRRRWADVVQDSVIHMFCVCWNIAVCLMRVVCSSGWAVRGDTKHY